MLSTLLSIPQAIILGIVEGITEFLPVSSTGHLLVTGELISFGVGTQQSAADTYSIAIQFGAIIAVIVLYRQRILSMVNGLVGRDVDGRRTLIRLLVAFLPAAVLGVVAGDVLKEALFGPIPVTIAWFAGGVLLVLWRPRSGLLQMHQMPVRAGLMIGLAQGLALWPGVSRSLVTLVAALAVGLTMSAAIEFSFLLGLLTLSAATCLALAKHGGELVDQFGVLSPLVGMVVACVTAIIAVRWMVTYLAEHSLVIFGWYRIAIAGITAVLLLANVV